MLIILCSIYFKSASPDGFKQEKPFVARLALAASIFPSILPRSFFGYFFLYKKSKRFLFLLINDRLKVDSQINFV